MMHWRNRNPIHVSREALTAFAWSAPMLGLAAKVGISDVGLKKILRSHGIVTPPQGHWNRVHAGRPVPGPPAAIPRQPGQTGRVSLDERFRGLIPESPAMPVEGPFASAAVPEDLEELRARELEAIGRVRVPRDLDNPHKGLVALLRKERQRREKVQADDWRWHEPVFDAPLGQRQLKLVNSVFRALERRGHSGQAWEQDRRVGGQFLVGDMVLGLSLAVIGKHSTEMIAGFEQPARDLPVSTPLCLSLKRSFRTELRTSWQDDTSGRLEARLKEIVADIIVAGEAAFRQSLVEAVECEVQRHKWEEERARQRAVELEAQRLEDLKLSGQLLSQAQEIRSLVKKVKSAVLDGQAEVTPAELSQWEAWALGYADRLDPVLSGQVPSHLRPAHVE